MVLFEKSESKITSVVKAKEADKDVQARTFPCPPNSVTHNICGSSRGIESNSIFFSFFNCFAIFVTISVFLFIFWFVYCWFLFRYWRHWPIHVESGLIKHLSRFSSSSFSEFLYQKMVISH